MADVVDIATRRRPLPAPPYEAPAPRSLRVVVYAADGSTVLDTREGAHWGVFPAHVEVDAVVEALERAVDVLEGGEWR